VPGMQSQQTREHRAAEAQAVNPGRVRRIGTHIMVLAQPSNTRSAEADGRRRRRRQIFSFP
jgi:hypothetical protein